MTISQKIIISPLLLTLLFIVAFAAFYVEMSDIIEQFGQEIKRSSSSVQQVYKDSIFQLMETTRASAYEPMLGPNPSKLTKILVSLKQYNAVQSAYFLDNQELILADGTPFDDLVTSQAIGQPLPETERFAIPLDRPFFEVIAAHLVYSFPFENQGDPIGRLQVVINLDHVNAIAARLLTQAHMITAKSQATRRSILIGAMAIVSLSLLITFAFIRNLTTNLRQAANVAHDVAQGNLNLQFGRHSSDETGQLLTALQSMVNNVREAQAALRQLNNELEQRVQERTAEIARQKYILDTFMASVPDSIYFKDCDSRFTHTNKATAMGVGVSDPAELIGKSDFDFFPKDQAQAKYDQEQEIIRTGQPVIGLEENDGNGIWMLTTKMPLRDEYGVIIGTFGISRDITPLKCAEAKILALNNQLKDENLHMKAEMELACRIQTSLLPHLSENVHPDFEIAAAMLPAAEVGGDYYDVLIGKDGTLWLAIGDVSGHGMTPGLVMLIAQTIHATITTQMLLTPKDVIETLNRVLYQSVHDRLQVDHFMTFTTLKYEGSGRFTHAGAHLDLIVYRRATQTCELIDTDGVFLNFIPDINHATMNATFTLDVGDTLLLYTDGLTETWNPQKKMLDVPGLLNIVQRHAEEAVETLRDAVLADTLAWCENRRDDDMSLVVVRRIR